MRRARARSVGIDRDPALRPQAGVDGLVLGAAPVELDQGGGGDDHLGPDVARADAAVRAARTVRSARRPGPSAGDRLGVEHQGVHADPRRRNSSTSAASTGPRSAVRMRSSRARAAARCRRSISLWRTSLTAADTASSSSPSTSTTAGSSVIVVRRLLLAIPAWSQSEDRRASLLAGGRRWAAVQAVPLRGR